MANARAPLLVPLLAALLAWPSGCVRRRGGDNTLRMDLVANISTVDPALSYDSVSNTVVYQVYEQLYGYHYLKRPYELVPVLARGMPEVSGDGRTYTIRIKEGVRYHDDPAFGGEPRFVRAQDFVTQVKRIAFAPTRSPAQWPFSGRVVGYDAFRAAAGSDLANLERLPIEGLSAKDDHTLVVRLSGPYPQFPHVLAMAFASPMPLEVVLRHGNDLVGRMVGTGPFRLVDVSPSRGARLERFEHFREDRFPSEGDRDAVRRGLLADAGRRLPFVDAVELPVVKESQPRWLNFRKGTTDLLVLPKDNFETAVGADGGLSEELAREGAVLEIGDTLTYWWLSFNMRDPVVGGGNRALRMAVAHAIDMDRYISLFTNDTGEKAGSIYPPGVFGRPSGSRLPYRHDPARARELLREAGHPGGRGLPVLRFDTRGTATQHRQMAEFVKAELARVGIRVEVSLNTFPAFLEKARRGSLQFWQDGWAMDYPDAENVLLLLSRAGHPPGPNTSWYDNPEVDARIGRIKVLADGPEKRRLMDEVEALVQADLPWVMQFYAKKHVLLRGRVGNYRHADLIAGNLKYLRLKGGKGEKGDGDG